MGARMVLIEQVSGGRRRRCDARCYNGKHARCRCVCGGTNHGKGLRQAQQNTAEMAEAMLRNARAMGAELHIPAEVLDAVNRQSQMRFSV